MGLEYLAGALCAEASAPTVRSNKIVLCFIIFDLLFSVMHRLLICFMRTQKHA